MRQKLLFTRIKYNFYVILATFVAWDKKGFSKVWKMYDSVYTSVYKKRNQKF